MEKESELIDRIIDTFLKIRGKLEAKGINPEHIDIIAIQIVKIISRKEGIENERNKN